MSLTDYYILVIKATIQLDRTYVAKLRFTIHLQMLDGFVIFGLEKLLDALCIAHSSAKKEA
jgi:hypothetical protein